ncbi:hypothetical protein [Blackfly microvirus SF02]|uniref:Uncharacterized protein n=1 Tax=Blackfly microvirus SF02 TaxID=2576452 RepID=A0A4P8PKK7_9VIRU|nr:hypothetical protein [Blackfly microvirus SF02]
MMALCNAVSSSVSACLISALVAALMFLVRSCFAWSSATLTRSFGSSTLVAMLAPFFWRIRLCVVACSMLLVKCLLSVFRGRLLTVRTIIRPLLIVVGLCLFFLMRLCRVILSISI